MDCLNRVVGSIRREMRHLPEEAEIALQQDVLFINCIWFRFSGLNPLAGCMHVHQRRHKIKGQSNDENKASYSDNGFWGQSCALWSSKKVSGYAALPAVTGLCA